MYALVTVKKVSPPPLHDPQAVILDRYDKSCQKVYILRTHHRDYLKKNFTRFKFKTVTVTLAGNIIILEELGGEEILYKMGVYV